VAAAGRLMLDRTGKPTPRLRASVLREELEGRLQRLQEVEHWIKESAIEIVGIEQLVCYV
jgi:hypothetical protein